MEEILNLLFWAGTIAGGLLILLLLISIIGGMDMGGDVDVDAGVRGADPGDDRRKAVGRDHLARRDHDRPIERDRLPRRDARHPERRLAIALPPGRRGDRGCGDDRVFRRRVARSLDSSPHRPANRLPACIAATAAGLSHSFSARTVVPRPAAMRADVSRVCQPASVAS